MPTMAGELPRRWSDAPVLSRMVRCVPLRRKRPPAAACRGATFIAGCTTTVRPLP